MSSKVLAPLTEDFSILPGYPSKKRIDRGMVAIVECEEKIPCNPCESSCRQNAIIIGKPITNIPILKEDRCNGCGLCVAKCPGQAIFILDMTFSEKTALVGFPYEFDPLPEVDQVVKAINRNGEPIGNGKIIKIICNDSFDKTKVIYMEVENGIAEETKAMRME